MTRACVYCNWWVPAYETATVGSCRAHPPAVDAGQSVWPATDADQWCGAFRVSETLIRHGAPQSFAHEIEEARQ